MHGSQKNCNTHKPSFCTWLRVWSPHTFTRVDLLLSAIRDWTRIRIWTLNINNLSPVLCLFRIIDRSDNTWCSQELKHRHRHTPSEGVNPTTGCIGWPLGSTDIDSVNTISTDWHESERGRLLRGRLHQHSTAAWNFSGYRNIINTSEQIKKIWLFTPGKRTFSNIPHVVAFFGEGEEKMCCIHFH